MGFELSETPTNVSKRRKVAKPPTPSVLDKETLPVEQLSSSSLESTTRLPTLATKPLPILHENADLWDADTVKARKAAVELNKAFTSHVDLSCFDKVDAVEASTMLILNAAKLVACAQGLQEKCSRNASLAAESHVKISKLTQDLEEAKNEVKLEKINQEIAERVVEQARHEKYIVELKSTGEKACLKRKIEELEMKLQRQKDRFSDTLVDAEVYGYNKCLKKAKEKGIRYKKLLLDPMYDPTDNQQEKSIVPPSAENLMDLDNVPDSTTTIPTVSPEEKALFDPAGPMFYSSIIEVLAKNNLEGQVGVVVSKKGDNGTQKPTSSSWNIISENFKQLKNCKTELARIKMAAFILGYNKCAESIGKSSVYDPSKHNLKAFVASEVVRLRISAPSSYNN